MNILNHRLHWLLLLVPMAAFINSIQARDGQDIYLLEDYDGNAAPGVSAMQEGQLVDVDGNGDKEARFVTTNFAPVLRLDIEPGSEIIEKIERYPVMVYTVAAVPGRNKGSFLQTMVQVLTNVKGGVYDVFPESRTQIPRSGTPVTVRLNLLEAETKEGVAFKDILEGLKSGDGSNIRIQITQQSSRDAETDCVYDDVYLEKAGG